MPKHALLSAGGAHRWLECTPSAKLESKFPNKSSGYAEEGTAAHALAELVTRYWLGMLADDKNENERIYESKLEEFKKNKKYYTASMLECATAYARLIYDKLTKVRQICEDPVIALESRDDFSKYVPKGFGTADCIIVADGAIEIIDFKYGKGHKVEAEGNPRMRLYAIGAIEEYKDLFDINDVSTTIFRPRITGGISSSDISAEALINRAETYVKPRANMAIKGKGEFLPSEETGKSNRVITDAQKAAEILQQEGYTDIFENPKLMGITKLEKLVGAKELARLLETVLVKPEGKPTLAPESDSRKTYQFKEKLLKSFDEDKNTTIEILVKKGDY